MRTRLVLLVLSVSACNLLHRGSADKEAGVATADTPTTNAASTSVGTPSTATTESGDEAGARALLTKFLAPGADYATLSKPLRPAKGDYARLFDAPTAAKLQPQYDEHWDKEPLVVAPKAGQTELKLWAATSEDLQSGKGNANEFPGGWSRVAPHLQPKQTWYRFKFVKPGEELGMAFDGLTYVNGHWVMTPKPWHGL